MENENGENLDESLVDFDPIANSTVNEISLDDLSGEVQPEKRVTVSDKPPEIYNILPDSTAVEPVEPPKPPPPQQRPQDLETSVIMDQKDLDKIISETLDVVDAGQKQANEQKLTDQKMAFILTKIMGNLYDYEKYVEILDTFLMNNEVLQSQWYNNYCQYLPSYGDYAEALRDIPEKITVDDVPFPVSEADLKKMTTDVVNNLYAGGTHVKTAMTMGKVLKESMTKRRKFLKEQMGPFSSWFTFMNAAVANQDIIREMLFKVSANVGFLTTGETGEPLTFDINKSMRCLGVKRQE